MFTVNNRFSNGEHEFCELIVHGDITLFRRKPNDGDNWEVQNCTGEWEAEDILEEIVTELFNSVPDGYSWLQQT